MYTVKKVIDFPVLSRGCHQPNSPWPGIMTGKSLTLYYNVGQEVQTYPEACRVSTLFEPYTFSASSHPINVPAKSSGSMFPHIQYTDKK
jgi:hypothetical protein